MDSRYSVRGLGIDRSSIQPDGSFEKIEKDLIHTDRLDLAQKIREYLYSTHYGLAEDILAYVVYDNDFKKEVE